MAVDLESQIAALKKRHPEWFRGVAEGPEVRGAPRKAVQGPSGALWKASGKDLAAGGEVWDAEEI